MSTAVESNIPDLAKMWSSHGDAASALGSYADKLEDLQRCANTALNDYAQAVSDRTRAQADHDDAAHRHSAATRKGWQLQADLKGLQTKRLAAVALHQSTGWLDSQIHSVQEEIRHQSALAADADRDSRASGARLADAEERAKNARTRIDQARNENEGYARKAGDAILAAVGIVHSHNPFVRAWEKVVEGVDTAAHWFSEYALDAVDNMIIALTLVALVSGPFAPIVGAVVLALSVVSLAGHIYRYANREHNEDGASLAMSAIGVIPFTRVLGRLAKASHVKFEGNLPGLIKRFRWTQDARFATGFFSARGGLTAFGTSIYRTKVVPKQVVGPKWLYKTSIAGAASQDVVDLVNHGRDLVKDLMPDGDDPGPASAVPIAGIPVATVQLQTTGAAA